MLPDAYDKPSGGLELSIVASVPRHVSVELGSPVREVRAWVRQMLRASVPKATVDEHSDSCLREHDVRTAA